MSLTTDVGQFKGLRGSVWEPGEQAYANSRTIFNMRTAAHNPLRIVQALDENDVATVMRHCHETGTPIAVRSGGHGIDATAMPDSALVLDLTAFKAIAYDTRTAQVRVGAGVLLGEIDRELEKHRRVVPSGTVSSTGLAGLCLGGGIGFNSRKYGATVDSLLACDIVTTNGQLLRASPTENPDLFWAVRGGGGNFGVVTSFEFITRPLPSVVSAGIICYPLDEASNVIMAMRDLMTSAPRELFVVGSLTQCAPFPFVPTQYHGKNILIVMPVYTGIDGNGDRLFKEFSSIGTPIGMTTVKESWSHINSMLDAPAPFGRRVFSRGGYLTDLHKQLVDVAVDHASRAPPPTHFPHPGGGQAFISLGGALTDDFSEDSAAFSREGANWLWEAIGQWDDPKDDQAFEAWTQAVHSEMRPFLRSNGYINLTMDQGPEWRKHVWGSPQKYERLVQAKTRWDPQNLLRFNKNILPAERAS
jgi:FAD/FMN-containing dehydrogenase